MLRIVQRAIEMEWPVRLLNPLIGQFNPFLPEYRRDPYPFYRRLQTRNPVYFSPGLRGWVFSRHADVSAVLQDARFSVDRRQATIFKRLKPFDGLRPDFVSAIANSLLMLDPPAHTRLRRLVNKAFTPRVVEGLRARVQAIVDDLLDRVASSGEMDLIRDLAYPLPVIVIAELLGVPAADHVKIKEWSDTLSILLDPMQGDQGLRSAEGAYLELSAYMLRVFEERRRAPRDDLISALVAVEDEGQRIGETEMLALAGLILGAGHETTTNLIGNAVLALLRHPAERRRLQDDPSMIGSAVEEFLRYDSPVQMTDRVATADCEVAGVRVKRGVVIALLLGAANRDPEAFVDPDRFDIGRADNRHVAFGHGVHFCLGAALARAEAQIAIPTLLRRFPDLDGERDPRHWKRSMVLRGPTALTLRLRGGSA